MIYNSVVQKYLLSLRSPLICCELYKTFMMVSLAKNIYSMLNLGLSYLRVVEAYKINTDLIPWKFLQN